MVRRADQRRATRAETRRREADEARAAAAAAVGGGGGSPSDSDEGDSAADSDAGAAAAGVPVSRKMIKDMKSFMKGLLVLPGHANELKKLLKMLEDSV